MLASLIELLDSDQQWWENCFDSNQSSSENGKKIYLVTGEWNGQGHFQHGIDSIYDAGKAGKLEKKRRNQLLCETLLSFSQIASRLLEKYKSDLTSVVKSFDFFSFGSFHLFIASKGTFSYYQNPNDFVSFLFPIQTGGKEMKGGLELGGLQVAFQWEEGDAILLNSRGLEHRV